MTNNHEIKLAKVGELVLVSGCEKPVPTRNFRILQAEKETKTDMMNPVMQRCSCREYAETAVPEELLRQLAAAGMQAPSAKNERPWEFLIVCSDEGKQKLAQASPYAQMCTNASAVIVVLADEARISENSPWWVQDVSACTENILIAEAHALRKDLHQLQDDAFRLCRGKIDVHACILSAHSGYASHRCDPQGLCTAGSVRSVRSSSGRLSEKAPVPAGSLR